MPRSALTDQQIAALAAAGLPLPEDAAAGPSEPAAPAAAPAAPVNPEASSTPAAPSAASEVTQPEKGNDQIVKYLQGQVSDLQASLTAVNVELSKTKDKLAAVEASQPGLLKIVAASVKTMKVGLGLSAVDCSAMSAEQLLAEHAATAEQFVKKLPTGGVAAVNEPAAPAAKPTPQYRGRVAATGF